ncbi:MAG: endonuclease V [Candidatus Diapherotrites archaeon CG11_big_fil_rev_8_21_14_0_20_37_9]|nr:MAG: endonuclease V [Candidatus Diapherotrites archaeon CG11_big_fil_rev_8_21_14_0_20_37_9]
MVRVNLIDPSALTDQHIIAEYNEILMLCTYLKNAKQETKIPEKFTLGKGHMKFFLNKATYLKKRHDNLKKEMKKRGFKQEKKINLKYFKKFNLGNWQPEKEDLQIIKKIIIEKIKMKPEFYRYYKKPRSLSFYLNKVNNSGALRKVLKGFKSKKY